MVKRLFLVLVLFLCVGCTNSGKKIAVEQFDYENVKSVSYVTDKHSQQIDEKYNVANMHFEYVINDAGNCSVFNKVSESTSEETYLVSQSSSNRLMDVIIYTKRNGLCSKIQELKGVVALANKQISYKNRVYINVISGVDEMNQSGLWVLDGQNKKLISKFRTMAADFDIDRATGNIYSIEYPEDGASYIREYNQNGQMINQYQIKDEDYAKLFIENGKLSLLTHKLVGEKDDEKLYNYTIVTMSITNFFNDLKNKQYEDILEIENNGIAFNTMEIVGDYIAFYGGGDSIICKTDYSKCIKYPNDIVEIFGGQGYIGINGGSKDDEGMYLNKFGTNGVEKLLNYAQSYFTNQEGKDIYFQVFNRDDQNKTKTIKYTLK